MTKIKIIFWVYNSAARFKLAIRRSTLSFVDHFKQFVVKFVSQNLSSFRILVFTKFLFTLQAWQFPYILLHDVLNCTLFLCIWMLFPQWGSLQKSPIFFAVEEILSKFLQIMSKKIIQTLCCFPKYRFFNFTWKPWKVCVKQHKL